MSLLKVVIVALMTIFFSLSHAEPLKNSSPQQIPFKKEAEVSTGQFFRVAGAFVLVVMLGIGAIYVLRRYLPGIDVPGDAERKRIRLLEVRRLTAKTTLFLVEVNGKTMLLSQQGERLAVVDSGEALREDQ